MLNTAYRNFFASVTGKRKGRKVGAPRFRSQGQPGQSIRFTKAARFKVTQTGRLRLPKIGDVPVRWSRDLPSEAVVGDGDRGCGRAVLRLVRRATSPTSRSRSAIARWASTWA